MIFKPILCTLTLLCLCTLSVAWEIKQTDGNQYADPITGLGVRTLQAMSVGEKNAVVCPLLLYNSLSLLSLGAEGATAVEIADILRMTKMELLRYRTYSGSLLNSWKFDQSLTYRSIIYYPESIPPSKTFRSIATLYFHILCVPKPDEVISTQKSTGIPFYKFKVVSESKFLSNWQKPLNPDLTHPCDFTTLSGDTVRGSFMHEDGKFDFYENSTLQVVKNLI